jgi:very-short-patch-repair endonuclease
MTFAIMMQHASRHLGLFTAEDAVGHGITRRQLERLRREGTVEYLGEAVYRVGGSVASWEQRMLAAVWRTGPHALASPRSALTLYELSRTRRAPIEVQVPRGVGRHPTDVRQHETRSRSSADTSRIGMIPVTSPERTIVDLAGIVPADRTEQVLDDAVHKGLTTSRRVADRLGTMPTKGRKGVAALWRLLAERTGDPDERANAWENLMSRLIAASDLPTPRRQHKVVVGANTYYLDFGFPDQMVAVECDSSQEHATPVAYRYDLDRQHDCESQGWVFKRFIKAQARQHPEATVDKIRDLLVQRGWNPPS